MRSFLVKVFGALVIAGLPAVPAGATDCAPPAYQVLFDLVPDGEQHRLDVHLVYDLEQVKGELATSEVSVAAKLHATERVPASHVEEVAELSDAGNYAVIAHFPLSLQAGESLASLELEFIDDRGQVHPGGHFTVFWRSDGAGTQLIDSRDYHSLPVTTSSGADRSLENLEPGETPGETNAPVRSLCGIDAACAKEM